MYKQKLQELCQQRRWALPLYTTARDGPDHSPSFSASVTVNGATFDTPPVAPSRTSKEAQNEAASIAFHHFTTSAAAPSAASPPIVPSMTAASSPPHPPSQTQCSSSARIAVDYNSGSNDVSGGRGSDVNSLTTNAREMQYVYKIQLQIYAQKRSMNLPTYDYIREGSLHAQRVKALVTVDGQTFESPQFFSTVKEAEHAAAKVALMSLSTDGNQEEEHGLYKNLLQELTQKEGLTLPTYNTISDGPSHMPTFFSTVEIEGEKFEGSDAKTRKQAEINAAMIAWTRLSERKLSRLSDSSLSRFQKLNIHDALSSLPSTDSQLPRACQPPVQCSKPDKENDAVADNGGARVSEQVGGNGNSNSTACLQKPNSTEKRGKSPSPLSSDAVYAMLRDPQLEESMLSDDEISPASAPSECLGLAPTHGEFVCSAGNGNSSSLCNRVRVYPRRPDFQLPPGTKLLPFSDETWVAMSVECSKEGSIPV